MSSRPFMVKHTRHIRSGVIQLSLIAFCLTAACVAQAPFTITASPLNPSSVDPGGSAVSNLTLTFSSGFSGTVDLTCSVTSTQVTTDLPSCEVSPTSETASSIPSLTMFTSGSTPAGTYQVLITANSGADVATANLAFNVADLAQDYTISVYPTTAIPSPVEAGDEATTTVTIAPIGGYTGTVTLSCLSVTPVVTGAPVCSFQPSPTVQVTGGTPPTTTLVLTTFSTINNPPTSSIRESHRFLYAACIGAPFLAFFGFGAAGKKRAKFFGIFLLIAIAGGLWLVPACGNNNTNTAANQTTPKNTYTFTLTGSDLKGLGPSSTSAAAVTLEVTAQP